MSDAKIKATRYIFFFALELGGMASFSGTACRFTVICSFSNGSLRRRTGIMLVAVVAIQVSYWHTLRHSPPFEFSVGRFLRMCCCF